MWEINFVKHIESNYEFYGRWDTYVLKQLKITIYMRNGMNIDESKVIRENFKTFFYDNGYANKMTQFRCISEI